MSENVPILILLLYDCGRCEYIYCMDWMYIVDQN